MQTLVYFASLIPIAIIVAIFKIFAKPSIEKDMDHYHNKLFRKSIGEIFIFIITILYLFIIPYGWLNETTAIAAIIFFSLYAMIVSLYLERSNNSYRTIKDSVSNKRKRKLVFLSISIILSSILALFAFNGYFALNFIRIMKESDLTPKSNSIAHTLIFFGDELVGILMLLIFFYALFYFMARSITEIPIRVMKRLGPQTYITVTLKNGDKHKDVEYVNRNSEYLIIRHPDTGTTRFIKNDEVAEIEISYKKGSNIII